MNTLDNEDNIEKLAPSSIKKDETVSNVIKTTDHNLSKLHQHLNDAVFLYRLDELSGEQLNHLANQWHAHVWRDSWDIETKRQVLRTLIQNKSHLGTKRAIVDVCQSLVGGAASIIEWFETEPQGTPHTFIVKVNQELTGRRVPSEVLADLINGINYAKPVRSQYTLVLVNQPLYSELDLSSVVRMMTYTHFYTNPTLWYEMNSDSCFSGGSRSMAYSHFYS